MLWTDKTVYREEPFETEADLEDAILKAAPALFGEARRHLDAKRLIGVYRRTRNIPDGYLIDLSSNRDPKLVVVENELGKHEPLLHVAVQILEFSLSYESSPHAVTGIVRDALAQRADFSRDVRTTRSGMDLTIRVAPESAITHVAPVASIEQWRDTNKICLVLPRRIREVPAVEITSARSRRSPRSGLMWSEGSVVRGGGLTRGRERASC